MGRKKKGAPALPERQRDYPVGYMRPPPEHQFPKGHSGNPAGRPRGSRNRINERFLHALCEDFDRHGETVIQHVRAVSPAVYLRIVARLVPTHVLVQEARLDELSDDELAAYLFAARQAVGLLNAIEGRAIAPDPPEPAEALPPVPETETVP